MFYIVLTGANLIWFLLNLVSDMLVASAIVTPKWLISNYPVNQTAEGARKSMHFPSVGIYTRCKMMHQHGFQCGSFDLDGFATDSKIYPSEWKASMFFITFGFALLSFSVIFSMLTCCKQAIFGKSLHKITACMQVTSAIFIMMAIFLHSFGWGSLRVQKLCGSDAEPFYPADCSLGISFFSAILSVILTFVSAGLSHKAESSHWRRTVKRRIEEGDRVVCIP